MNTRFPRAPLLVGLVWLALLAGLYAPAIGGALFYDDYNALDKMAEIESFADAREFVFGGTAGPLGRPLALASYLPHAADWPASSPGILAVNIGIHLFNAVLLAWLAWLLLRLRGIDPVRAAWIALGAAVLWSVLPMIASASLIVIQRMTTLASTFMLLGLVGFVAGYFLRARRPRLAFVLQFGALGLGTLAGLFTKETAALAPVFALVIDTTLARRQRFALPWLRALSAAALWGALALLLWYLSPLRVDWFAVYENRGWTPWERLQYQVVVLWEYVRLTLAPLPTAFGPFHDWRDLRDFSALQSLLAALAWLGVALAALWLHLRRDNPWPLFVVAWFLAGHLLESTTMNLELVFEHRNYLAVFGLALALAVAAAHAPPKLARIAPALFVAFVLIQAGSLYALTSLWGDRPLAAERWAERYPGSARAALHAAFMHIGTYDTQPASTTQERAALAERQRALAILDRTADSCERCADVRMQALLLGCLVEDGNRVAERLHDLRSVLAEHGRVNRSLADGFFVLKQLVTEDRCDRVDFSDVIELTRAVEDDRSPWRAASIIKILFVQAHALTELDEWSAALDSLDRAERLHRAAIPVLQFQVYIAEHLGDRQLALDAIERRRAAARSKSPMSDDLLDDLTRQIEDWGGPAAPADERLPAAGDITPQDLHSEPQP